MRFEVGQKVIMVNMTSSKIGKISGIIKDKIAVSSDNRNYYYDGNGVKNGQKFIVHATENNLHRFKVKDSE